MRIQRFSPMQRVSHLLLLTCFMLLSITGLGRLYEVTAWGRTLTDIFGGPASALAVHKAAGLVLLGLFMAHLLSLAAVLRRKARKPEDLMLPRRRDLADLKAHLLWMLGQGEAPRLERWSYWEKFDYWAVFWGMAVMGVTGLILYDPVAGSKTVPGWGLNVALWVHRIEALLAMGHVFLIHFFVAHLRRDTFPMDHAVFEGTVDAKRLEHERPDWMDRLRAEGELDAKAASTTSLVPRFVTLALGLSVVGLGLVLVVSAILNFPALRLAGS